MKSQHYRRAVIDRILRLSHRFTRQSAEKISELIIIGVLNIARPEDPYPFIFRLLTILLQKTTTLYKFARPLSHRRDELIWRNYLFKHALEILSMHKKQFDIPYVVTGSEELVAALKKRKPLILFTAHFGLNMILQRLFSDLGRDIVFVNRLNNSERYRWGLIAKPQFIWADQGAFLKARKCVRDGCAVVFTVDKFSKRSVNPIRHVVIKSDAFRFAADIDASVLFFSTQMDRSGGIIIKFICPKIESSDISSIAKSNAEQFLKFISEQTGWICLVD
jgi:hypothetical protein